ncbi:MAG: pyridoxamine 5-phosphate oxidase [Devosia sp.]|nr:pyridoxamine 5-phosphate oxidase [Devosia sp.]
MPKVPDPPPTLREVTPAVMAEVRTLIDAAHYGSLGTLDPADGYPNISRVNLLIGPDGGPLTFISALAAHTVALRADPRCGLLIGEVGKGDPVAYPRLALKCHAEWLPTADALRSAWLTAHPKAQLYIDLPDFSFVALRPVSATYIDGFGRAYALSAEHFAP